MGGIMFEDEQSAVAELLRSNPKFRELYEQHESLDQEVEDAVSGVHPMGDGAVTQLKRRKLFLKDRMASMIHHFHMVDS
jgi:uncharacterized protein YdcH (DUF465 family)